MKLFQQEAVAVIADPTVYDLRYTAWQTIKLVSVTSLRTDDTHDPIQLVEFMNAPKFYLYSSVTTERDRPKFSSSRSQ